MAPCPGHTRSVAVAGAARRGPLDHGDQVAPFGLEPARRVGAHL